MVMSVLNDAKGMGMRAMSFSDRIRESVDPGVTFAQSSRAPGPGTWEVALAAAIVPPPKHE